MTIFGLSDPWIIAAYAGCIISVIFCIAYGWHASKEPDEEDDSDD